LAGRRGPTDKGLQYRLIASPLREGPRQGGGYPDDHGWRDVDGCRLGDICKGDALPRNSLRKKFFSRLRKPLRCTGNHDIFYEDEMNVAGRKAKGSAATRRKNWPVRRNLWMKEAYVQSGSGATSSSISPRRPGDRSPGAALENGLPGGTGARRNRDIRRSSSSTPARRYAHAATTASTRPASSPSRRPLGEVLVQPASLPVGCRHMHVPATNESYSSRQCLREAVDGRTQRRLERKRPWTNVLSLYPEKVLVGPTNTGRKAGFPTWSGRSARRADNDLIL